MINKSNRRENALFYHPKHLFLATLGCDDLCTLYSTQWMQLHLILYDMCTRFHDSYVLQPKKICIIAQCHISKNGCKTFINDTFNLHLSLAYLHTKYTIVFITLWNESIKKRFWFWIYTYIPTLFHVLKASSLNYY